MHFGDYSGTALKKSCFFDEDIGQDISRFSVEFFQGMAGLLPQYENSNKKFLTNMFICCKIKKVVRTTDRKAGIHLTLARVSDLGS